jgi:hypothetical protein
MHALKRPGLKATDSNGRGRPQTCNQRLEESHRRLYWHVFALWAISSLTHSVRITHRATDWISIPGVILASSVGRCGDGTKFAPRILYRFDVDGSVRLGDRIALDHSECGTERRMPSREN